MAGQNNIKFLKYDKSMIDRLKPYGPPKIKWDAGRGIYENVSKKYFEEYKLGNKIFVNINSIKIPEIDTDTSNIVYEEDKKRSVTRMTGYGMYATPITTTETFTEKTALGRWSIKADFLKIKGFGVEQVGSYYIEKQNLDSNEWSENAVVASNTFVGNYIFEQNGQYKTENRKYILVPDKKHKDDLKKKLLDLCGKNDIFFDSVSNLIANKVFSLINRIPEVLSYFRRTDYTKDPHYTEGKKYHELIETRNLLSYCGSRKIFESQFNGPSKFYNQNFELSKPNRDITQPPESGVELFNENGLDGIYGLKNSFAIARSGIFGVQYKAGVDDDDYDAALTEMGKTMISISSSEIIRYISDIIDICILFLKNDSSVYKEMADKLFPFISEGGDKEEFQKAFFANFLNGFIHDTIYMAYPYLRPVLINSEVGNYSTAEIISSILSNVKSIINSNVNRIVKTSVDFIIDDLMYIWGDIFSFSQGYGYFDEIIKSNQIPWPPVEKESDLENLYHSVELQLMFSLEKYSKICGNVASSFFVDDSWQFYSHRAFIQFVADHLIIAEDSQEMAITKTEEEGPDGEKRDRTTINEFDIRKSVRDITNSIWYLDDYNWSMDRKNLNELGMEITDFQKLRIYELQPDRQISFKRLTESLINAAKSVYNSMGSGAIAQVIKGAAETALTAVVNEFGTNNIESQNYATNVDWISELLQGTWVGQYDVPFFGKNFLKADTTDGWSMGNLADSADFLKNDLTTNVQDIPTWAYKPGKAEPITTTVYLLNEDVDSIIKNLKFLHSITAGAWWVQTSFIGYRQPNLYRVLCPGRFIMLYSSMAITVEMVGKIRRYSQQDAEEMFGKGAEVNSFMPFKLYTSAGEGNCNIPEAYKLTLKLQDLTPQVFNVMANFFTNGYGNESTKLYPNIFVKQLNAVTGDKIKSELGSVTNRMHL